MKYLQDSQCEFDANISISDIKEYFRNDRGPFFSMFETGLNDLRFDLLKIDPFRKYVRIFEFKSGRADFVSDKKWRKYLEYCHTFTFVCPVNAIKKEELPKGIGLIWIYKWRWNRDREWEDNKTWILGGDWIQRPRRREVKESILLQLALTLLHRVKWRGDAVF